MKTIEINTSQNVKIEYELAGLKERILASFVDLFVISFLNIIYSYFILIVFEKEFFYNDVVHSGVSLAIRLWIPIFLFLIYHFLSELLFNGQSIGKKLAKIKVVKLNGKEPSVGDCLLRSIFYLIDIIMSIGVLGSLLILSTEKKQRLGDLAANTTLVKTRFSLQFGLEEILNIHSLDNYEPTYPDVKKLTEQDMLLIKSLIMRQRKYNNKAHRDLVDKVFREMRLKIDMPHLNFIMSKAKKNGEKEHEIKISILTGLIKDYIVLTR